MSIKTYRPEERSANISAGVFIGGRCTKSSGIPKGSADPSGLPGDFVQLPPMGIAADSLALRSSGLYVLIYKGTIPDVSQTD